MAAPHTPSAAVLAQMTELLVHVKPPPRAYELYVFGHTSAARHAGFRDGCLPQCPEARAWVLDCEEPYTVRALILSRVYITDSATRSAYGNPLLERKLAELHHVARGQLRAEPRLWMEI